MDRKHNLMFEKLQVVVMALLGLALVYGWLWQPLEPADPQGPIVLLTGGRIGAMLLSGAMLVALAFVAGLVTISGRPEGAMLAALVAMGGITLRSDGLESLLWSQAGSLRPLYLLMAGQMLLLGLWLVVAEAAASAGRALGSRWLPQWTWENPLARLTEAERSLLDEAEITVDDRATCTRRALPFSRLSAMLRGDSRARPSALFLRRLGGFCLLGTAVGVVLVFLLMRSPDRGQILFALFAGFVLSVLLAEHMFPTSTTFLPWLLPILAGCVFYVLAAVRSVPTAPDAWVQMRPVLLALPIDWCFAGGAGAMLGAWLAGRMREIRIFEKLTHLQQHA